MRTMPAPVARVLQAVTTAAVVCLGWLPTHGCAADEPAVIAVVAVDPYADLKKQAKWVGGQIDQPTLDGFLESFIMMATQFKGLAGLDVGRPAGVVVTAEGPAGAPVVRGFVPVKDLGKLLAALQGVIGPCSAGRRAGDQPARHAPAPDRGAKRLGDRRAAGQPRRGRRPGDGPRSDRKLVLARRAGLSRADAGWHAEAARSCAPAGGRDAGPAGTPVDADALATGLANLDQVETIVFGANVDVEKERVYLENQFAMVPNSAASGLYGEMAKATSTIAAPATADGKPAAVRGHAALSIPESLREAAKMALMQALPVSGKVEQRGGFSEAVVSEPTNTIFTLLRQVIPAMLDAGGMDAALAVDTSAAEMAEGKALPAVTVGMKVKDGRSLEANLKAALGAKGTLPAGVTARFDAGKAGAANLHVVEIDLAAADEKQAARLLGQKLPVTLGVTPTHAFVAIGGDAEKRIAAAAGGGTPDPNAKPLAGLDVSLAPLVAYAAGTQKFLSPGDADGIAVTTAASEQAAALPSSLVQLLSRPIERGLATRLSADAGAIKVLKSLFMLQQPAAAQPVGVGPPPMPKGRPIPLPGLAP